MTIRRNRLALRAGGFSLLALSMFGSAANAETVAREDLFGREVRVERTATGETTLVVAGREPTRWGGTGNVATQRIPLGDGAVWIARIDGTESHIAIVAGSPRVPAEVLFAGPVTVRGEDVTERFEREVVVADLDGDRMRDVVLAERRSDVTLCALGRPLVNARAVHPRTFRFANVSLNPLRTDLIARSQVPTRQVFAVAHAGDTHSVLTPLFFTTRVQGGRVATPTTALTDRNGATVWSSGNHEFVVSNVTLAGAQIERVVLTAPPAPAALPRTFTLVFDPDGTRIDVTIPGGVQIRPGARVAIPIVPTRTARCMALIATNVAPQRPSGVAEVELVTSLDHESDPLATLARRLDDNDDGDDVARVLAAAGDPGMDAIANVLSTLNATGSRRAVRTLANATTSRAATALVGALPRAEITDEVRLALTRMGPPALGALATIVAIDPRAASIVANVRAPLDLRVRGILPALAAPRAVFHEIRPDVRAVAGAAARGDLGALWLDLLPTDAGPRARGLSIAAESATEPAQLALVALRARAMNATEFPDRYRLLLPLAGDDEGRAMVTRVALEDPDDDLRAEAVRVLTLRGPSEATLMRALSDRVPRVRATAATGLRGADAAREALEQSLASDSWPTVRASAATSLAGVVASVPALIRALDDTSPYATRAVIASLGRTPETSIGPKLLEFAEDAERTPELRIEALGALANRCEYSAVDRLLALFLRESDPMFPPPKQAVGHASLAALAHIDPVRARAELVRLEANAFGIAALQRAMRNACPGRALTP